MARTNQSSTSARRSRSVATREKGTDKPVGSGGKEVKIGGRLKHARLKLGLRLRDLADKLGCSESFISKLENDKARPSLAMLHGIVEILNTNIASLFSESAPNSPVTVVRAESRPVIRTDPILKGPGIALECLVVAAPGGLLDANIHCVEPGGHTDGAIEHIGEEIGYVLNGRLELKVEDTTYLLKKGDSFFFRSDLKHSYRNPGKMVTRVLWVNSPPTF